MTTIHGAHGVSATVLKDSVSPQGIRHLVFEVTYWRGVLAELNTHRALSKASASSRAIPFDKMAKNLTGRPHRFGEANPGMQDKGEDFSALVALFKEQGGYQTPEAAWEFAKAQALFNSQRFYEAGYHKQVYNRLTEPFQMMKTVISGTEWGNFFWLRDHEAADPSLHELARVMREAKDASTPMLLQPGEWALPYVEDQRSVIGTLQYFIESDENVYPLSLEQAKAVSAARCAAVSFRNVDYDLAKSEAVFARLVGDDRKHASAFEHQVTPMQPNNYWSNDPKEVNVPSDTLTWEEGVSHCDRQEELWSGNVKGFIQHRKLIAGENHTED